MISYNPKDWFKLIFHFHKSDTFRILLPTMIMLAIVTAAICYAEDRFVDRTFPSLTVFHQLSGFIISLVLVFRINTAYDRWWEGRKQWGALVNNCRNLAIRFNSLIPAADAARRKELLTLLSNYPYALKEHLRNSESFELEFSSLMTAEQFRGAKHKPNFIASKLTEFAFGVCHENTRSSNDLLLLSGNLDELTNICGACERIKNTPIPYSYSLFIKKIIFVYIITMPVAFGLTIGYWSILVVVIMFYAFASLELISEEIEEPFGTDSNDLPTDEIAERIKNNITEILLPNAI
jgi:ion channel-forming bestrophin family protein